MRWPELSVLVLAIVVASSACSRLTFVKPSAQRKGMERVAPEYSFSQSRESRQREAARRLVATAEQKLQAGQLDAAEADARAAVKQDRSFADGHTMLGLIAGLDGRLPEAGRHYQRAAELDPSSGPVLNNYGAWLCGNGRSAESLAWFDRALAEPGYYGGQRVSALANAGSCAMQAGQMDRVEPYLRAALTLAPESTAALAGLSEYMYRSGRFMEARAFSERRLAAAPPTAEALLLASRIETSLGDAVAAERYSRRLREEFPQAATDHQGTLVQP